MSWFVSRLPFRSSSLCDSNASSMCAFVCASFGGLRSACPSMAHDPRPHWCKKHSSREDAKTWTTLWSSLRTEPLVSASVFYAWTDCRRDYSLHPFPRRRGDRLTSPTDYLYPEEDETQVRWETNLQCWEVILDSKPSQLYSILLFNRFVTLWLKTDKIWIRFIPVQYRCERFYNMTPPTPSNGKIRFYTPFFTVT